MNILDINQPDNITGKFWYSGTYAIAYTYIQVCYTTDIMVFELYTKRYTNLEKIL